MNRIAQKFAQLKANNQKAFCAYICAGDPDYQTSLEILKNLAMQNVDFIELGIPFLDPAGDGPIIEEASRRSISNGMTLKKTIQMVAEFRQTNSDTPIILMGYFNPILKYGIENIFIDAKKAGVDAFLIVDLPHEEEDEIINYIKESEIDLIRLIAPTTSKLRAQKIIKNASGFLYLISMLGTTGTKNAKYEDNISNVAMLKEITDLPISIGYGIKTPEIAQQYCNLHIDNIIVGSSFVDKISQLSNKNNSKQKIISEINQMAQDFIKKIKNAKY